jgi:hypothetical protein
MVLLGFHWKVRQQVELPTSTEHRDRLDVQLRIPAGEVCADRLQRLDDIGFRIDDASPDGRFRTSNCSCQDVIPATAAITVNL